VVTDETGRVTAFQEKPRREEALSNTINTGIYVFEPEVFDYIPPGRPYDIGSDLFPTLVKVGAPFYGVKADFQWVDIGRTHDYWLAVQKVLRGEIKGVKVPGIQIRPGVWTGINIRANWDRIHIEPPVYIGASTYLADGVKLIGPTAIGYGCVLNEGCTLDASLIFNYTQIAAGVTLRHQMVMGRYCISSDGEAIDTEESNLTWLIGDARSHGNGKSQPR
jgi:mannose-1-phosphate guanylyltransferase